MFVRQTTAEQCSQMFVVRLKCSPVLDVSAANMVALKRAIFLTVIAVIAVIAVAIVMWLFAAFYGVVIG